MLRLVEVELDETGSVTWLRVDQRSWFPSTSPLHRAQNPALRPCLHLSRARNASGFLRWAPPAAVTQSWRRPGRRAQRTGTAASMPAVAHLRTGSGFLECHVVMPDEMPLREAHLISERIEQALREEAERMVVTIHMGPEEEAQHRGVLVL
ncbi:cation transporter dimerization domain-containing protein [Roseomonas chloroacetimidivorans]|uniref:cation transporter dimerization domain-containing protein n=1 Tax=Roseomonas chloroacetimidivorans TaxID=1766656 RepID=UPI003C758ACB